MRETVDGDPKKWVPRNCKLILIFDPVPGEWSASVRLAHDYLGYLVHESAAEMGEVLAKARAAYEAGRENPQSLSVACASYFREATHA